MFRLRLLGTPCITGAGNDVVTGRVSQRHRLAMLALLALSRAPGMSRDRLLGYLWPDSDTAHGRNLLKQSLHVLRSTLGEEALQATGDDLQLDTDTVRVDVLEFESALNQLEYDEAVAIYGGPFLDGYFLADAPEFERWAERERQRLAAAYARALEWLAESATAQRDFATAVERWKTLSALDPYDSRITLRLMAALQASGNPAAALQLASAHVQLLHDELEAAPPSDILRLAERIRAQPLEGMPARPEHLSLAQPALEGGDEASPPSVVMPSTAPAQPAISTAGPHFTPRWRRRSATAAGVAAVVLAAVAFALWLGKRPAAGSASPPAEPTVAVIPLANLSTDPGDAILADGVTEELIAMLARAGNVRVLASSSTAPYRNRQVNARAIADSLGVTYLVEGSVQKIDTRLRVRLRLVDGRDGTTVWAQVYARAFDDVLAVQEEIARAVAGELGLRFDRNRQLIRHHTRSVAAYQLYLRGSDPLLLRSEAGVWKATDYFRQAIAIDSTYAAAHAGMALMYVRRARTARDPQLPRQELLDLSRQSASRAIRLDSTLAEAHYALAQVYEATLEFSSAERAIRRAIEFDPSRSVYRRRLSYLHGWTGERNEELMEARLALEIDPLNPYAIAAYAGALFGVGRDDEALAELERLAGFQPPLQATSFIAAQIYAQHERWAEAIVALRPLADAGDPHYVALLGHMLARAGQRDEANQILANLLARQHTEQFRAFQIAVVYAGLGDLEQTFAWLDKSIDDKSISSLIMGRTFDYLHQDPRFAQLRCRLGLESGIAVGGVRCGERGKGKGE